MTVAAMFSPELAENKIFPISNMINDFQPVFIVAIITIGYSLYRNYDITKSDNRSIFRTFWRSGVELQIMLWGTLASLMFNLGMLFTESIEIKIGVAILAGIMIGLNIERYKIVNYLDKKWMVYSRYKN